MISHVPKIPKPKIQSNVLTSNQRQVAVDGFEQNPADFVTSTQNLDTGNKSFKCKFCGYDYHERSKVTRHVPVKHITEGPVIKCNLCEYTAKLKFVMKHYMGKHQLPESMADGALY